MPSSAVSDLGLHSLVINLVINLKLLSNANSFLLNIAEHEIFSAVVGIFIFISRENFMLSRVEHENSFITSSPGYWSSGKPIFNTCLVTF